MIVTRIKVPLEQDEYSGLMSIALQELRNPSDQLRQILRQELKRRGLLEQAPAKTMGERHQGCNLQTHEVNS